LWRQAQSIGHADESLERDEAVRGIQDGRDEISRHKIGELATGARTWPPQGSQPGDVKSPGTPATASPPPIAPRDSVAAANPPGHHHAVGEKPLT